MPVFAAFVGMLPTPEIARVLQEEAAGIFYADGKVRFARLADLMAQPADVDFPKDRTEEIAAGFLERHAMPFVFTTDPANAIVQTRRETARGVVYRPRADRRIMNNMSMALIQRRKLVQSLQPRFNAGARVDIGGMPHIIITAAHVFATEQDEGEPGEQRTQLWLGEVVR